MSKSIFETIFNYIILPVITLVCGIFKEDIQLLFTNLTTSKSNTKRISWRKTKHCVKKLVNELIASNSVPFDVIVTIGRSGAIIGALISASLPPVSCEPFGKRNPKNGRMEMQTPILGVERFYRHSADRKEPSDNGQIAFMKEYLTGKRILLVRGNVQTGETLAHFRDEIMAQTNDNYTAITAAIMVMGSTNTFPKHYVEKNAQVNMFP